MNINSIGSDTPKIDLNLAKMKADRVEVQNAVKKVNKTDSVEISEEYRQKHPKIKQEELKDFKELDEADRILNQEKLRVGLKRMLLLWLLGS
jgi:D-ribose pyranose/furanose isomerase RbsD